MRVCVMLVLSTVLWTESVRAEEPSAPATETEETAPPPEAPPPAPAPAPEEPAPSPEPPAQPPVTAADTAAKESPPGLLKRGRTTEDAGFYLFHMLAIGELGVAGVLAPELFDTNPEDDEAAGKQRLIGALLGGVAGALGAYAYGANNYISMPRAMVITTNTLVGNFAGFTLTAASDPSDSTVVGVGIGAGVAAMALSTALTHDHEPTYLDAAILGSFSLWTPLAVGLTAHALIGDDEDRDELTAVTMGAGALAGAFAAGVFGRRLPVDSDRLVVLNGGILIGGGIPLFLSLVLTDGGIPFLADDDGDDYPYEFQTDDSGVYADPEHADTRFTAGVTVIGGLVGLLVAIAVSDAPAAAEAPKSAALFELDPVRGLTLGNPIVQPWFTSEGAGLGLELVHY